MFSELVCVCFLYELPRPPYFHGSHHYFCVHSGWTRYFRSQEVADEVQVEQVHELFSCGVISGFVRRIWGERLKRLKVKTGEIKQSLASLSSLLCDGSKRHTHATQRCWPGSRFVHDAPQWRRSASAETNTTHRKLVSNRRVETETSSHREQAFNALLTLCVFD